MTPKRTELELAQERALRLTRMALRAVVASLTEALRVIDNALGRNDRA